MASLEGPEFGGEGLLAVVSDLASGLGGLAKTLAYGRSNGYRAGTSILSWPKLLFFISAQNRIHNVSLSFCAFFGTTS